MIFVFFLESIESGAWKTLRQSLLQSSPRSKVEKDCRSSRHSGRRELGGWRKGDFDIGTLKPACVSSTKTVVPDCSVPFY